MATIAGTPGNDVLNGTDAGDVIHGVSGNDTINAGKGDDYIDAGLADLNGHDTVNGGAGNDFFFMSYLNFGFEASQYDGGTGADLFDISVASVDLLWSSTVDGKVKVADVELKNVENFVSGAGNDTFALTGQAGPVSIEAGQGNDRFQSLSSGNDTAYGGQGNDRFDFGPGADQLFGQTGDDEITLSSGQGSLAHGGDGSDTVVVYSVALGQRIDLAQGGLFTPVISSPGQAPSGWDKQADIVDFENVIIELSYTVIGDDNPNVLQARSRSGSLPVADFNGAGGNDQLIGFNGDDTLAGGVGDDLLEGGAGADRIDGGDGVDTASYASAAAGVAVSLNLLGAAQQTQGAGIDTLSFIENLTGSGFIDVLVGNAGVNVLRAGAAADAIYGGDGADTLYGEDGTDTLFGESGDDVVIGGADPDLLGGGVGDDWLEGGAGDDYLYGYDGNDRLDGGAGSDLLDGQAGIDTAIGGLGDDFYAVDNASDGVFENAGEGNDVVFATVTWQIRPNVETLSLTATTAAIDAWGDNAANVLVGNDAINLMVGQGGNDWVEANGGNDRLLGGDGIDRLDGGAGNDTLEGGPGTDILIGGAGADIFRYNSAAESSISAGFDYIFGFEHGIDKLVAVRQSAADTLSITASGADSVLWIDYGGNGSQDLAIVFIGVQNITAADVILG